MGFRMAVPWRHPKTGMWWLRRGTPADLLAKRNELAALGIKVTREVKQSLRTRDRSEAQVRWCEANAVLEKRWNDLRAALRDGPRVLSQREIFTLSADFAKQALADGGDNPGSPTAWANTAEGFGLIETYGAGRYPTVDAFITTLLHQLLKRHGLTVVAPSSLEALKVQFTRDLPRIAQGISAMAGGDYRLPDWLAGRPSIKDVLSQQSSVGGGASGSVTFDQLIDGWQRSDAEPRASSVQAYRVRVKAFIRWAGHDDAARVTKADVQAWKEAMLASEGRNLKGIRVKLEALRGLLKWGIDNGKLPYGDNPAAGVTVRQKQGSRRAKPVRGYTDDEARLILRKSRGQSGFLRWAPWLLAYTGMRAGELAQLRRADVTDDGEGKWTIAISGDAGTVKTPSSERNVPLHSAVAHEGFGDYVRGLGKAERLFPELYASRTLKGLEPEAVAAKVKANAARKMARWLYGKDVGLPKAADISPQHSWRHRLTTLMRRHDIEDARMQEVLGHAADTVTDHYGEADAARLRRELERIPALRLED